VTALVEVVHFADAACPWDYSAEPVRIALEERYGAALRWRTVKVGVHRSGASMAHRGTAAALPEIYGEIGRRFGMPFCTADRAGLHGSLPAARMVKAAEMQGTAAGAALLRRLRLAGFVEVRPTGDRDALLALAAELDGIDLARLATDFDRPASLHALDADMALARRPDRVALALGRTARPADEPGPRFTTPTYAFHAHGLTATVPGFQPLEAYEVTLHNLAPELRRRPAVEPAAFLASRAGEPLAALEVAAATDRALEEAGAALDESAARGLVRRIAIGGEDELWCYGPPTIELRCRPAPARREPPRRKLAA
jgi:predicted DsbA family dithiol-disulfide isomerase